MKDFIAYCGLDCETCEARVATLSDDNELRRKVAELRSELNHAEITPEMINRTGCRIAGVKTPYSGSLCPIRRYATAHGYAVCGDCCEMEKCGKLGMVTGGNEQALKNLKAENLSPVPCHGSSVGSEIG